MFKMNVGYFRKTEGEKSEKFQKSLEDVRDSRGLQRKFREKVWEASKKLRKMLRFRGTSEKSGIYRRNVGDFNWKTAEKSGGPWRYPKNFRDLWSNSSVATSHLLAS